MDDMPRTMTMTSTPDKEGLNESTIDLQSRRVDVHASVQLHLWVHLHHQLHKAREAFHQTACKHKHTRGKSQKMKHSVEQLGCNSS
jgi:hypothetical protein